MTQPYGNYQLEVYFQGLNGVLPNLPMSFAELESRAEQALSPSLWSYIAGGAGKTGSLVDRAVVNHHHFSRCRVATCVPHHIGNAPRLVQGGNDHGDTTGRLTRHGASSSDNRHAG